MQRESEMTNQLRYSNLQILLHWAIAALILASWFTGDGMGRALSTRLDSGATGLADNTVHVWIGLIVFALILARACLRMVQGAPGAISGSSAMMTSLAKWGHRLIYLLMVLVPTLGILAWYGHIGALGEVHETLANALMLVALGHAAAAIWHQFIKRDGTLERMRFSTKP